MRSKTVAVAVSAGVLLLLQASSASAAPVRIFANCADMHQSYKGGVARPRAVDVRKGAGKARYAPVVNLALYNANKKSDRDEDGIACER